MMKKRGPVEAVNPAAKRICRENKPAGLTKGPQRSIFNFLDHWGLTTLVNNDHQPASDEGGLKLIFAFFPQT